MNARRWMMGAFLMGLVLASFGTERAHAGSAPGLRLSAPSVESDFVVSDPALALPLDEPAGSTAFVDVSGSGNHGSCTGGTCPSAGVPALYGRALDFDGVDDRVVTPLVVDQSSSSPGVTMMAWVYPTSVSAGRHHVLSTEDGLWDWSLVHNAATWEVFTGEAARSTGFGVDLNTWQHVAAVFDPLAGQVRFYKNGVEAVIPYLAYDSSSNPLVIGDNAGPWDAFYQGGVDEVLVYDRVLSAAEVQAIYSAGGTVDGDVPCNPDYLIGAIHWANATAGPNTLDLAAGCTYTLTGVNNHADGPNGLPSITGEITIHGNDAIIGLSGIGARSFHVATTGDLTLDSATLRDGWGDTEGAGIMNLGTLALVGCTLRDGTATSMGGGIYNTGTMTLTNSTLLDNDAYNNGGGVYNTGTMTLTHSTLSSNAAFDNGGGIHNLGAMALLNSTLSGNYADATGGALYNEGVAELAHSTVSQNDTNVGWQGPGSGLSNLGTLRMRNTIVAGQAQGQDCYGNPILSEGYNLDSDGTCGLAALGDRPNTGPLLGPLQDNGGPTLTHDLQPGSPAVDQGNCPDATTDQRGVPRPQDLHAFANAGDSCDIGAVEVTWPVLTLSPASIQSSQNVGEMTHHPLTVINDGVSSLDFQLYTPGTSFSALPMDDSAGATTFLDVSGNRNDGTCSGVSCPTAGVPGHHGTALAFDGIDDYVTIPTSLWSPYRQSHALTMMAWVYPTSLSAGTHHLVSTENGLYDWSIVRVGAVWHVYTGEGSRSTGVSVDLNAWQHIAAVFDPVLGGVRFYKNGAEVVVPYLDDSWGDITIGGRPWLTEFFDGRIDDVRIALSALSASEVQAIYQDIGLPWLSVGPLSGTVPVGGSVPVQITLDATGLTPGVYGTRIAVQSNDPTAPVQQVPVNVVVGGVAWNDVPCDVEHLRISLHLANGNGTPDKLNLASGCTYSLTPYQDLDGPTGLPSVTSEVTVNGNGATIERGGGPDLRILHVGESGDLTLSQLSVDKGSTGESDGGNIWNAGTLTLSESTVHGGRAMDGAGIYNLNTLTVERSTILGNTARYNDEGDGGGIYNTGTLTLTNSTLSGNSAANGGGLYNVGEADLAHATLATNWIQEIDDPWGQLWPLGVGAGIFVSNTVRLHNTIVDNDCFGGPIISLGYNLDSDGTCGLGALGDQPHTEPLLGPLQPNGGPTATHAPGTGSPAIDGGSCADVSSDQRGIARPLDLPTFPNADDGCDVGAVEADWPMLALSPARLWASVAVGATGVQSLTVGNDGPAPLDYDLHVPFPAPNVDLWLPLDEAAGATTFDDLSDRGNDASCTGSSCPTAGVPGWIGTALSFDGVDDSVDTPLNAAQSWYYTRVTMMAWVYPASTSAGRHMVFSSDDGGYDWSLLREGGTWYVFTGEESRSTGVSVDVGQWQHVAAVFDPELGGVRFYKNGVETFIPYLDYDDSSANLAIGNRPVTRNRPFDGRIDDAHVYLYAVDAQEIGTIYREGSSAAWLSYAPISGTVPPYSSTSVALTLDATGLTPGVYRSQIVVHSGDPTVPWLLVPVDLFAGVVWNDVTCDVDHLRAALDVANANGLPDTLNLAPGCVYTLTEIDNDTDDPNGLPSIAGEVVLHGNGATIERDGAAPRFRILHVATSGDLAIDDLTVRGGAVGEGDWIGCQSGSGAGIFNRGTLDLVDATITANWGECSNAIGLYNGGTATLTNSTVSNNGGGFATGSAGIHNDGAMTLIDSAVQGNSAGSWGGGAGIGNGGTMTLTNSIVSGNSAAEAEGGITNWGALNLVGSTVAGNTGIVGGGIGNSGSVTLTNCAVLSNTSWTTGGGIESSGSMALIHTTVLSNSAEGGGGINNTGVMTLIDSTVDGNSGLPSGGGGIQNHNHLTLVRTTVSRNQGQDGGGILNASGFLVLINSTVSNNDSGAGDGGGIAASGTVALTNSTITQNQSGNASSGIALGGTLTLVNTVVAGQLSGDDCTGSAIVSLGHNLDSDGTCGLTASGDISNTAPLLGALQDNGGPTETHELLEGSPAIDAGDDAACQATGTVAVDQRGVSRPQDGDADGTATCDIGAYERVAPYVTETQPVAPGDAPPVDFPTVGVTVDCSSGPGGTVTITRYPGAYPSPPTGVNTMTGYWDISASFSPYVCDLIFHYDEADLGGATEGDIAGAARWDLGGHGIWGYYGGLVDTSANKVMIPDVSDFSAWLILTSTPPQAVGDLDGTRAGSDLQIDWPAVTLDILGNPLTPSHYVVYRRANEAHFVPSPADVIATPSTDVYTDTGVLGDPAVNYYYMVTAVDGAGVESAGTRRLGAFNYGLTPAAQAGERAYNLIALPLEMPYVVDADTLAAYAGPGVYMVLRHDAATQGIEWRLPGLAGTNFPAGLGSVPYLYLDETAATGLSLIGIVSPSGAVGYSLTRPAPGGSCTYNFISVPLHRADLVDADALAADIGGVYTVGRYNAATQDLTWRMPGGSGENFPVRPGYPYIVCLDETAPSTWPHP